jgi:hypothetical protein
LGLALSPVLVFQVLADRDFEATPLAGFEGVLVVADVRPQLPTLVFVAPVARRGGVLAVFPGSEDR